MKQVINEVIKERERQARKFGEQTNDPIEWIAILAEVFGQAAKESKDYHFVYNPEDPGSEKKADDAVQLKRLMSYRKEMIEVGAVAVNAVECLDNQTKHALIDKECESPVPTSIDLQFMSKSIELLQKSRDLIYTEKYQIGLHIHKDDNDAAVKGALASVQEFDNHIDAFNTKSA